MDQTAKFVYKHPAAVMAKPLAEQALHRQTRQAAGLAGSFSSGYGHEKMECPEGVPVEQAVFGILAAFAASFGFLFRAVTMATGRRKKRSSTDDNNDMTDMSLLDRVLTQAQDMAWMGRQILALCVYIDINSFGKSTPDLFG